MRFVAALALAIAASAAQGQITHGGAGNSLPGSCEVGSHYTTLSPAALYICSATNTWTEVGGGGATLPSGMIAAFNAACPTGWTEVTAARGRVIVGVPASGTLAGTVGNALTNLEDRTHTHTYTQVPNHVHVQRLQGGTTGATTGTHLMGSTATGGSLRSSAQSTLDPTGGVATATTNTAAASSVLAYIQYRYCSKD